PAPPTSETSPLSLHDALPISSLGRERGGDVGQADVLAGRRRGRGRGHLADHGPLRVKHRVAVPGHAALGHLEGGQAARALPARLDRKSTRLNSSHLVISYAVF